MSTHETPETRYYRESAEDTGRFSLAHLVHAIRRYSRMIIVSTVAVAVLFAMLAIAAYLLQPTAYVASLPFRLDFDGATEGHYPNELKFSPSDVVATPVLLRVFNSNGLNRYLSFVQFSRSVVVIESNSAYQNLVAEYQARFADTRLSPVDRDRIEREFEMKRQSINKNEYSLVMTTPRPMLPDTLTTKVLNDILTTWANISVNEKRVVHHQMSLLSPNVLESEIAGADYIVALQILRSRVQDVIENIETIRSTIPGSELLRTPNQGRSLAEIRMHLEELTRFRVEPLTINVWTSGLVKDREATIRFLETKRAWTERRLRSLEQAAEAARKAYSDYANVPTLAATSTSGTAPRQAESAGETVMPQMTESFLDRLVDMAGASRDAEYRQQLVEEAKTRELQAIPFKAAVGYDNALIETLRNTAPSTGGMSETEIRAEFEQTKEEVRRAIQQVNTIYDLASRNLNPSNELYTITAPASARLERAFRASQIALVGLLVMLVSTLLIIGAALIHNRFREEESLEQEESAAEAFGQPVR